MNTRLNASNAQLFFIKYDGSALIVHLKRQSPGKININTAARLPRSLITSPILGITNASINDKKNHTVTTT